MAFTFSGEVRNPPCDTMNPKYSTLFLKNFDFSWDTLMPASKSFVKIQSTSLTGSSFVFEKIIKSSTYKLILFDVVDIKKYNFHF